MESWEHVYMRIELLYKSIVSAFMLLVNSSIILYVTAVADACLPTER